MEFFKKLDFLMNLTSISNSRLAKQLNVDPSLLSRWRRGMRKPGSFSATSKKIADIISAHIEYTYQREEIALVSNISIDALSCDRIQDSLFLWLNEKPNNEYNVEKNTQQAFSGNMVNTSQHIKQKGRKEAVKILWQAINNAATGKTLRVYIDEPTSWADIISLLALVNTKDKINNLPFSSLKLMFPATINYSELVLLWRMVEHYLERMTLHVSILERHHSDIFQHAIFITGDYALLSSFGFQNCDNFITVTNSQKSVIQETISSFDYAFDKGENGLIYLEHYTIWEDFKLFNKIFTVKNNIFYFGSVLNPLFVPPDILKKTSQSVLGAKTMQTQLFENIKNRLLVLLQTNKVYTTFPLYTPDDIDMGKARIPNIPQFVNRQPTVSKEHYKEMLIYINTLYRQYDYLHIMPLYEDTLTTFGVQEYNTLSVIQTGKQQINNYYSKHSGITATAARAMEEKFKNFENANTKKSIIKMIETQIELFK